MSAGHGDSGHTGGGHTTTGAGLDGHERSAALPASIEPSPSPPLFAPTGNVAVDALAKTRLGIPPEYWIEPLYRDVPKSEMRNFRLPNGSEAGANPLYKPGGYTSGGALEGVIDPVPMNRAKVTRF